MAVEGGVARRIEADASQLVEASLRDLGDATANAAQAHEARVAESMDNATLRYFQGKDGKTISPEDLAVLHYLESGGEGLPGDDQLAPRLEAAEKVFSVISATDMLLALPTNYSSGLVTFTEGEPRRVSLNSAGMRSYEPEEGDRRFINVSVVLPGADRESVSIFSLIDREGLAAPVEGVKAVDGLFKRRREEIIDRSARDPKSPLPILAGSVAVSRFAVNLGVRIPLGKQDVSARSTRSFYGFVRALAGEDAELGRGVVEEVRERKPKAVEMIKSSLRREVDGYFEELLSDEYDEDYALKEIRRWFGESDVQLFYTEDEQAQLREGLIDRFVTTVEQAADRRITSVAKGLEV